MLAAETTYNALIEGGEMKLYWENLKKSWIWEELYKVRNYRPVSDM
jgi:electron-transferring-flavoprotein dehydrogenase